MIQHNCPSTGLFVTGTDTGVGKTFIACDFLRQQTQRWQVRKPVESGCELVGGDLLPSDGAALQAASGHFEKLNHITPYRYIPALAPDRAARLSGDTLNLELLIDACSRHIDSQLPVLVEGAGGICSPLTDDALNLDLAEHLGLPVMLVVADRLGCINHTLLSLQALASRQLSLRYLVLNSMKPETDQLMDNQEDIERLTGFRVSRCRAHSRTEFIDLHAL